MKHPAKLKEFTEDEVANMVEGNYWSDSESDDDEINAATRNDNKAN